MQGRTPLAIDCFAGAGGLSLGLKQAGFDIRCAFDLSEIAVSTYNKNIGEHAAVADALKVAGRELLERGDIEPGGCSIVTGGPPCQGFSIQRRGDDGDDRNQLIFEFLRIVEEVNPELFVMENVSAILAKRGKALLEDFFARARRAGFITKVKVLDAADFGVPQHRKRVFIVGERDDRAPLFEFPKATHDESTWVTVREAIGDLPSPMLNPKEAERFANHHADQISELNRERISHVPPGGGREHIPEHLRLPCHRVSVEKAGHRNVYGRLDWDAPAGTITTKCNSFTRGKFAHPAENRNITMREAARLQGFPDDFVFLGDRVAVAHQIGNAVPPPLARALGDSLLEAIRRRSHSKELPHTRQRVFYFG